MINLIAKFKSLFKKNIILSFELCKLCMHGKECHSQFHFGSLHDFGWELACSGKGKRWFSTHQKCRCWKFERLTNLEYLEMKYEEKQCLQF
jgi:hypothetical protein